MTDISYVGIQLITTLVSNRLKQVKQACILYINDFLISIGRAHVFCFNMKMNPNYY